MINTEQKNTIDLKYWGLGISILMVTIGLFFNRVILSSGVIGMAICTFDSDRWALVVQKYKSGFYGLGILLILVGISAFWSTDINQWWHRLQLKLPLLIIPISLLSHDLFNKKDVQRVYFFVIGTLCIGCLITLLVYFINIDKINAYYSQGRVMWVPFQGDHQRFSWAVLCAFWMTIQAYDNKWISGKYTLLIVGFFAACIHFLATRTALSILYLSFFISIFYFYLKNKKLALVALGSIVLLPILAYLISSPFKNKIYYMLYDINQYRNNSITSGLSDASRFVAAKGAWDLISDHPITGIGYGDIKKEFNDWYITHPDVVGSAEVLMPPSQYLFYILSSGILALIFFPVAFYLITKGFSPERFNLAYVSFQASAIFLVLIETPFEVQRGPIIYGFFLSLLVWGIKYQDHE